MRPVAAALERRYSRNTTCSLQAVDLARHGGDVCQLTSAHEGWPVEPDSVGTRRISVAFGESDCAVTLTGCNPDTCYTIFDLSSRGDGYAIRNACAPLSPRSSSPRSAAGGRANAAAVLLVCRRDELDEFSELMPRGDDAPVPSIFSAFSAEGAALQWTRAGVSFVPVADTVTITYSTHTCASFYSVRGRAYPQTCESMQPVLTLVEPDIPSLMCPTSGGVL